jgi:hypothetical protein
MTMRITVIIANTWRTTVAVIHENQMLPYGKRSVTIELTPEQCKQLTLRKVGTDRDRDVYEEIFDCFVDEPATPQGGEEAPCPKS